MAGGFAHVMVTTSLREQLRSLSGLTRHEKLAVSQNISFTEIGAVAPDYPYLAFAHLDLNEGHWADKMHYERTAEPIRHGLRWLRQQEPSADRDKALAWLLGYAAHVGTDLTIHPVVQMRVGPYEEFPHDHRICEMHQDAFIWRERNRVEIGVGDYFNEAIRIVSDDDGELAAPVREIWAAMMNGAYPEAVAEAAPDINAWHQGYRRVFDRAEEGHQLIPITRHILAGVGATYPATDEVDESYIVDLETPDGVMHYNDIFDAAVANVAGMWATISTALNAEAQHVEDALAAIPAADLDTGCYLAAKDEHVFWRTT